MTSEKSIAQHRFKDKILEKIEAMDVPDSMKTLIFEIALESFNEGMNSICPEIIAKKRLETFRAVMR